MSENKIKEKDLSWKTSLSLESRPISFRSCESTFQSNAHIFSPSLFRWTLNVENANIFSAPEKSNTSTIQYLSKFCYSLTSHSINCYYLWCDIPFQFFNLLWLLKWQMSKWKRILSKIDYMCSSPLKLSGVAGVMHSMPSASHSFLNSNDSRFSAVLIREAIKQEKCSFF